MPRTRIRCAPALPCECSESCWPSAPLNSSSSAQRRRCQPTARSSSASRASANASLVTAPSRTRSASRSAGCETGFAETTEVSNVRTPPSSNSAGIEAPPCCKGARHSAGASLAQTRLADHRRSGTAHAERAWHSRRRCFPFPARIGSAAFEAGRAEMNDKLQEIEQRFERLTADLGNPEVIGDRARFSQVAKERAQLEPLVEAFREHQQAKKQLDETRAALGDAELRDLARDELPGLEARVAALDEKLKILLLPKDRNDERSVILEVRAGAGGDEAGLFAAELLRMYLRYAERKGWKTEMLSRSESGLGGIKEGVVSILAQGAYSALKYEGGVHRVQRVPATE